MLNSIIKKLLLSLISSMIVLGCKVNEANSNDVPQIKIEVAIDEVETDIASLIKSYSFIRLETTEASALGRITYIETTDSLIFLYDDYDNTLLSYTLNGEFNTNYIHLGQGPGEVSSISAFMVQDENNEVVIYSSDKNKNIIYSIEGEFLREEKAYVRNEGMIDIGESIAFYTGHPTNLNGKKLCESFLMIQDHRGVNCIERFNSPIKGSGFKLYQSFWRFNNQILFRYPFCDTIFLLSPSQISAKYTVDFGSNRVNWSLVSGDTPIDYMNSLRRQKKASVMHYFFEFKNWVVFEANRGRNFYYCFYNKETARVQVFDTKEVYNSQIGVFGQIVGATDRELISLIEPLDLLFPSECFKKAMDQSQLFWNEFLKSVKSTDNPILLFSELR